MAKFAILLACVAVIQTVGGSQPVISSFSKDGFEAGIVKGVTEILNDNIDLWCNNPIQVLLCNLEQQDNTFVRFLYRLFGADHEIHPNGYCKAFVSRACNELKSDISSQISKFHVPTGDGLAGVAHVQFESGEIEGELTVDIILLFADIKSAVKEIPKKIESLIKIAEHEKKPLTYGEVKKIIGNVKSIGDAIKEIFESWSKVQKKYCEGCNGQCLKSIPGKGLCKPDKKCYGLSPTPRANSCVNTKRGKSLPTAALVCGCLRDRLSCPDESQYKYYNCQAVGSFAHCTADVNEKVPYCQARETYVEKVSGGGTKQLFHLCVTLGDGCKFS